MNLRMIESRFEDGAQVDPEALAGAGLISNGHVAVKVLGQGDLTKKLRVTANAFSQSAIEKITKAGGSVNLLGSEDGDVASN